MRDTLPHNELRELVDWYTDGWGPVDWSELKATAFRCDDISTGRMLYALSLIEADSQTMRRRLSAVGVDRSEELLEFITIWLAEEGEHSRALAHMAHLHGYAPEPLATRTVTRDLRALLTWPTLYLARGMRGICAAYCTLGSMQELVALTTYHHLASKSVDEEVARVLKAIARQESHHMRFYRNAAAVFLRGSASAQRTTRQLIRRLWRPPGMDLLGMGNYEEVFGPILSDPDYATKLLRADRTVSALPGLGNITVMADYLDRHDFRYYVEDTDRDEALV